MNNNKKLGIILLTAGAVCVGTTAYLQFSAENRIAKELENRLVVGGNSESDGSEFTSTLAEAPEFTPVDADMQVEEVKVYKNVLEVPSCDIKVPLMEGVTKMPLNKGAGHFPETPKIGEEGNACYAGHYSTVYTCIFNNLPNIKMYDEIHGYNENGEKTTYYVTGKYVTTPDNISVLAPAEGVKDLTIVTCSNNGTMRLIISARALDGAELEAYKRESQQEKRDSMYVMHENMGSLDISSFIENGEKIEKKGYSLPNIDFKKKGNIKLERGKLDDLR